MTSSGDYQERVQDIVPIIEDAGCEIQDQIDGQTEQGHPVDGYLCRHGDHALQVVTSPGWEWFDIRFEYNADQDQAVHTALADRTPEQGEQINVEVGEQAIATAADQIESRCVEMDVAELRSLRVDLMSALSRSATSYRLMTDDKPLHIHGFSVSRKLWLEGNAPSLSAFGNAVQTTVNAGRLGQEIYANQYGMVETSAVETHVQQSQNPNRGFQ